MNLYTFPTFNFYGSVANGHLRVGCFIDQKLGGVFFSFDRRDRHRYQVFKWCFVSHNLEEFRDFRLVEFGNLDLSKKLGDFFSEFESRIFVTMAEPHRTLALAGLRGHPYCQKNYRFNGKQAPKVS